MKIRFSVDQDYFPERVHIIPSENENTDTLHKMSQNLYINNPTPEFIADAKSGKYDNISDLEYEKLLSVIKRLSLLFLREDGKTALPARNIFDLLAVLLYEYTINHHSESSRIL